MAKLTARIVGIVLIVVGLIGFAIPFHGLLNLSVTHDLVHLVSGALLVAFSGSQKNSMAISKVLGVVYLLVAVLGLFVQNVAGLIMLMPGDTVIHFVLAIVLLAVGFSKASSNSTSQSA